MRKLQIASGTAFVAAWIVGLVLAANGPGPKDSARKVASYFAAHEHKAMVAHFLIDGVPGLAIIGIAVSLHRYLTGDEGLRRVMFLAGLAAGLASLVQMTVGEVLT